MRYETILFDLDGTLTDSGEGIINSVIYALEKSGREVPEKAALYRFIGPPLLTEFQAAYGVSPEEAETLTRYFREYFEPRGIFENRVYDGIPEALAALRSQGRRLIVATSKPEPFAVQIVERFGLSRYFDFVAGSGMDERTRSTKAAVIAYALERAGAAPDQALMVGDRAHDVLGAHEAGVACLGVLYGYGDLAELQAAGADYIRENTADLVDIP